MSDLIDDPRVGENATEYTVSEISGEVKKSLEAKFGRIRVKGEIGRVMRAQSGHLYYDLKDERNTLACTTWKGQAAGLAVFPEEGLEVVATGKITAFGGQSKYNLNVDDLAVAGIGALMALLEKRKKALAAEGLFEDSRKKSLPYLPDVIGIVSSPSGAVIRDIMHRMRARFPRKALLWPVTVQGPNCAAEVAAAIEGFNALKIGGAVPRPDLIIVARGGGSIEDLWGFNEEIVVRAAATSGIPLISAVGHETDTTLIDYAADRRAPTPTAAAEMALPVREDLQERLHENETRLRAAMQSVQNRGKERLQSVARRLPHGGVIFTPMRARLEKSSATLYHALHRGVQGRHIHLARVRAPLTHGAILRALEGRKSAFAQMQKRLIDDHIFRLTAQGKSNVQRLVQRMLNGQKAIMSRAKNRLEAAERLRETLGYKETLKRGYVVVRDGGRVVMRKADIAADAAIELEFTDGRYHPLRDGRKAAGSKPRKPPPAQKQERLL